MEKTNVQRKSGDTDAEREQAATIIQAFYRGYRVRKELKKKEKEEQQKEEKEEQQKKEKEEQQQEEDADSSPKKPSLSETMTKVFKVAAPVAVGVGAVVATPAVIGALGFGTAGISAGSVAAKGMSFAATRGVGMSVISTCQSIGALAALSGSQAVTVGTTTTAATAAVGKFVGWLWKK